MNTAGRRKTAPRSEEIIRILVANLAEREPQRSRTKFGKNSLKLTKFTLSNDIEAYMKLYK